MSGDTAHTGEGGELSATHVSTVGFRLGSVPHVTQLQPSAVPATGGTLLRVTGNNVPVLATACGTGSASDTDG